VTALDRKETSDQEVAHKLQEVKEAAKAQEPIGVPPPQKPVSDDSNPKDVDARTSVAGGESSKASTDAGVDGEKSVAGRKTMKGGETKDVHSGKGSPKDSPKGADKQNAQDGETAESEEDHAIETELNLILKKGPSRSPLSALRMRNTNCEPD